LAELNNRVRVANELEIQQKVGTADWRRGDTDYVVLARSGHVTRAPAAQIMKLLLPALDIQETILQLPRVESVGDPDVLPNP
jgi:hypothetical protein